MSWAPQDPSPNWLPIHRASRAVFFESLARQREERARQRPRPEAVVVMSLSGGIVARLDRIDFDRIERHPAPQERL